MKTPVIFVLLSLALAGCAHTPAPAAQVVAAAPVASLKLHEPLPGVYTAGQPAQADWAQLKAHGIHTVINLRTPGELKDRNEAAEVRAAGMDYLQIPVAGAAGINADNARLLHAALGAGHGGGVLVHCASSNRAGALLALEQVRFHGLKAQDASALGRKAGMTRLGARLDKVLGLENGQ